MLTSALTGNKHHDVSKDMQGCLSPVIGKCSMPGEGIRGSKCCRLTLGRCVPLCRLLHHEEFRVCGMSAFHVGNVGL